MKASLFILLLALFPAALPGTTYTPKTLPNSIQPGPRGRFHVQGIAVDQKRGFMYFSFTNELIKTDMEGKLLGSVTGLIGHLGDLTYDADANQIYGSLEYKADSIGKGITKKLGIEAIDKNAFYVVIFDADKITKPNIEATKSDVMKAVYLRDVVADYEAKVEHGGRTINHRYGCSGIDGITIGPAIGAPDDPKKYLYVAYGIYSDLKREDNDHQVILRYDYSAWSKAAVPLSQGELHAKGPQKFGERYFVMTGNTSYGIQNLEYDPSSGNFFAAVYRGQKPEFPNYYLFVIDGHKKPFPVSINSDNSEQQELGLSLLDAGLKDEKSGVRGWNFRHGSTGLMPLGDNLFYISKSIKVSGKYSSLVRKYQWNGSENEAFTLVE